MEIWKDIKGYEGKYLVSNKGLVKSLVGKNKDAIKSCRKDSQGYLQVDLYKDGKQTTFRVHRLVAINFIENPLNKETVNHIDGNKENNCVENLEWATFKEQNRHFYDNGLKSEESIKKSVKAMNEATSIKVIRIEDGKVFESASEAGRQMGLSSGSAITMCCKGKHKTSCGFTWQYA